MKKLFVTLTALVISVSLFAAAATTPVTQKILAAFRTEFSSAKSVKWVSLEGSGLYQATFEFNGGELNAYYNEEGELVSTARYIKKEMLPLVALKQVEARYPTHLMRTIIEVSKYGTTGYYITLVSEKSSLMVQASASGNVSVYKRIKNN